MPGALSEIGLVSPSTRPRPRARRRLDGERRDELLGRIQDIVLQQGFLNLTIDALAAQLQCSKSTLYAVASSKEGLVTTAIREFLREVAEHVEEKVAGLDDPAAGITTYLATIGSEMRRMSPVCFDDMGVHDSTREIYLRHSAALRKRISEFIEEGISGGYFRSANSRFVASSVSLLIDGIEWRRLLHEADLSPEEAYAELSSLILGALKGQSARHAGKRDR